MGSRKRSRPNPKVEATAKATEATGEESTTKTKASDLSGSSQNTLNFDVAAVKDLKDVEPKSTSIAQSHKSQAWYTGGTWPRIQKSTPSIKLARETILADKTSSNVSADFTKFEPKKPDVASFESNTPRPPSMYLGKSKESQGVTLPEHRHLVEDGAPSTEVYVQSSTGHINPATETNVQQHASGGDARGPATTYPWLSWLGISKPENYKTIEQASILSMPSEVPKSVSKLTDEDQLSSFAEPDPEEPTDLIAKTSWFSLWPIATQAPSDNSVKSHPAETRSASLDKTLTETHPIPEPAGPMVGSTWAFWSKESGKSIDFEVGGNETGELAVDGENSQNNPTPAHATPMKKSTDALILQRKRGRPQSIGDNVSQTVGSVKRPPLPQVDFSGHGTSSHRLTQKAPEASMKISHSQSPTPSKPQPTNLLLPSFRGTYRLMENPSIIKQIARLLMHGRQSSVSHVHLLRESPRIKKSLAIGIHGLFPAALLRTVIGQPTGTSIRFANHAAAAIHRWANEHGCDSDIEIEKIALEGEGKIAERVDNLWKLLLNWMDHIRGADFILVACHSQGVPVAVMLVAKLIEFGVVTSAKIGICAMAGVSLGPFSDYKSRLLSGSAAELFDFANPESEVSKRYEGCLRTSLNYGVRITYIGSIDDQLVSLESAIFASAHHPYIYRSVFVDGRVHAPDFIAHLVGFALKLRNLGVSDHGLIRELSAPLAGSLYTGEGHSRLYDEAKIYDVAVQFALETSSVGTIPLELQKYDIPVSSNPFQLPWSMRGLLEENIIKTELDHETKELLRQFDDWKPSTKVLKDVKYRLEAVKSKI